MATKKVQEKLKDEKTNPSASSELKEKAKKVDPKASTNFEVKASLRFLRMSPKKVRLVVNVIRNMSVEEALDQLQHINKAATDPLLKLLKSAIANAENNFGLESKNLKIKKITVDDGPTLRRWMPRAHGRATPIRKRSSHINLILEDISGAKPKKAKTDKKEDEVKVVSAQEIKEMSKEEGTESKPGEVKENKSSKGFTKRMFSRKTGT
ncbi:50S ribosomal protein L22 [Patescibacteria group bacterium]|nr:50S ribosomal protein L22 [Patescibacteria group bacterium]